MSRWTRATNKHRCPVCDHPSWCCWTERQDGTTYVICMRQEAGCIKTTLLRDSSALAYHHVIGESGSTALYAPRTVLPRQDLAPIERRHAVITDLLVGAGLRPAHIAYLNARGISEATAVRLGYASVPAGLLHFTLIEQLAIRYNLRGVPGFYTDHGTWTLAATPGILLPVRDRHGLIAGCQINTERAIAAYMRYTAQGEALPEELDLGGKYVWLSSVPYEDEDRATGRRYTRRKDGVGPAVVPHFHVPDLPRASKVPGEPLDECVVVEGVLKCDRVALMMKEVTIGMPGVGIGAAAVANFLKGVRRAMIAYDMDWLTNTHVKAALGGLLELTREVRGLTDVWVAKWSPEDGKGLDDLLGAEHASRFALQSGSSWLSTYRGNDGNSITGS